MTLHQYVRIEGFSLFSFLYLLQLWVIIIIIHWGIKASFYLESKLENVYKCSHEQLRKFNTVFTLFWEGVGGGMVNRWNTTK